MADRKKDTEIPNDVLHKLIEERDSAFKKFPLLFILLATFGVMATFYGFQHIIEKIPLLANNPVIALCVGLLTLFMTGALYKKLG